jgi:transcriptional regulator GlxA family with amidase domain
MGEHDGHPKRLRIGFILARDFTLSAFSLFVDTLRLASDEGDRSGRVHCDWEVVSSTGHHVRSSAGIEIAPTAPMGDPRRFSHIAVVGGLLREEKPVDSATLEYLASAARAQIPLIGICTGAFVLAKAGLLNGRKACVSWYHVREFCEAFPDIPAIGDRLFFVDGNRITCSGGAGAADLAAFLVERHLGLAVKQKALQVLQIERARAPSDPQPRSPLGLEVDDDRVRRALLIMEQSLLEPQRISAIARKCGLSTRALERAFNDTTGLRPNQAYVQLRLRVARDLVLGTRKTMTEIGVETGFAHSSNFSRRFKEAFGVAPTALRFGAKRAAAASDEAQTGRLSLSARH